jgi:hypothetical protein
MYSDADLGEAIWFAAYLVQMMALAVGGGLVSIIVCSTVWNAIRHQPGEIRHREPVGLTGSKVGPVGGNQEMKTLVVSAGVSVQHMIRTSSSLDSIGE